MADKQITFKILSDNRRAGHEYFLLERFEAGMVLTGTEVKAAKDGKVQLKEAYAAVLNNEAWLVNAHISEYSHGNRENHPAVRNRKLLLHRKEIDKLLGQTREKGLALIPTEDLLETGTDQVRDRRGARQETARQASHGTRPDGRRRGPRGDAAARLKERRLAAQNVRASIKPARPVSRAVFRFRSSACLSRRAAICRSVSSNWRA